jgi:hypothetical protein
MNPQPLRNWESSLLLLYLVTAVTAVFGRSGDRHKTLPPFGGIFDESIISSLGNLGRYFRTFFPPLMIQNIKNMQKTNATDNILKIVTFTPSQPFGAEPQKPKPKSKANVTLKVIINPNVPINIRINPANFLSVITELNKV